MVGALERKVSREILILYRSLPCLWDKNDDMYNNRLAKMQAYEILLKTYRTLEPDANIDSIRKKIGTFRTGFRRELGKIQKSRNNPDEFDYKPKLWYFNLMLFLRKKRAIDDDGAQEEELYDDDDEIVQGTETIENEHPIEEYLYDESPPRAKKRKKISSFISENNDLGLQECLEDTTESVKEDSNSEAELYGRTLGIQLKALNPQQKAIAEKIISDIIFYGRLDKLSIETSLQMN